MAMRPCIGLILAGGRSKRMGEDKARLPLAPSDLLAWQVARLAACCDRIVVSGDYPEFETVPDVLPGLGPLAGLHAAVLRFPNAALWALPVDMPGLCPERLQTLRQQTAPAFFADSPLPAWFPDTDALAAAITAMLTAVPRELAIHQLHARLHSRALPALPANEQANLNTPEDWVAFSRASATP
jgi:molybdopterin-guanine dinucleotide biosynthesis protein A